MEVEPGKLFIGGISWDTNDGRLKDYFQTFGEVVEAVIMKDRNTGRARGFGFVVFADASVAEKVLKEKHIIDGRMVEAKKAVPRDDQTTVVRNSSSSSIHGSPGPGPAVRTKKIFVGGLASNVTESEFKRYFDQFGIITDVVVMYDHNTQRPRGFGFITFDSEEAVDKVLVKIFHELGGKMVEVKRAVPKELSPGPNRSPLSGYNSSYGMGSRVSSLLNNYVQGQGGLRIDGRLSPITIGRNGYPPFSPTGYGMSLNFEPGLNNTPFGLNGNLSGGSNANFGYGRPPNSYYGGSSSSIRYNGNGAAPPAAAALSSPNRSMWLNGGQNVDELIGSGMGNMGFGNIGTIWGGVGSGGGGSSTMSGQGGINAAVSNYNNSGNNSFLGSSGMDIGYRRNNVLPSGGDGVQGRFGNLYGGDGSSMYLDSTWRLPPSLEFDVSGGGSFGYGSENLGSNVASNSSVGYIGDYNVSNRSTRGIVT
ncbi:heterogeneous nuclear ribonucleoprotein 1-like [Impatiens glandulifera]|uniref:heterogeneous nuclear ribonucleoprotein 1-like n=1 Tax=Impatiens glandulifera TaxID=253017 RepID=UPI001FB0AFA0|nr:heterogeneous nuclear ribonucleoprotein 1-like [Impatiens glandulifera]XP_047310124.1 heterogeneous nuclear ribonucleoprotein 1-like [Impatiens glandulifera]